MEATLNTTLQSCFVDFLKLLYQEKMLLTSPKSPQDSPTLRDPMLLQKKYVSFFEKQANRFETFGGIINIPFYASVYYLWVAMLDECLITWPWEGATFWRHNLLEEKLFGSHEAGTQVFQNLELLLATGLSAHKPLMSCYLTALVSGFSGQFLKDPNQAQRLSYAKRLFERIYDVYSIPLHQQERLFAYPVVPQNPTLPIGAIDLYFWHKILACIVLCYLGFTSLTFWYQTRSVVDQFHRIAQKLHEEVPV